jgi:hypothetical protein
MKDWVGNTVPTVSKHITVYKIGQYNALPHEDKNSLAHSFVTSHRAVASL